MTRDRWWLWGTITAVIVLTSIPQVFGYATVQSGKTYIPHIAVAEADTSAYYSNIEQVRQGRFLVSNQFTSEEQQPSLFHPLWILLGWIARILHVSTPIIFQVARVGAILAFVLVLDVLIRRIPWFAQRRWMTLWIVLTSSGVSWLVPHATVHAAIDNTPTDLWVSEANTFLTLMHSSLFILSQLMIGFILWQLWRSTMNESRRHWRWVGPVLLGMGLMHPYDLLQVGILFIVWGAWCVFVHHWSVSRVLLFLKQWAVIWLWTVPIFLYYPLVVLRQPAMYGWLQQNYDVMGPLGATFLGFGFLLPLALMAAWYFRRERWIQFLTIWAVTLLFLSHAPGVSIQRRLLNGIHIPLALLTSAFIIQWLRQPFMKRIAPLVAVASVFILARTNMNNIGQAVQNIARPPSREVSSQVTVGQLHAMEWIRNRSSFDDVTWSNYWDGNALAGLMARTVALGHSNQTVNFLDRAYDWYRFTAKETSTVDRHAIVRRLRVTFLLWFPARDALGQYDPATDAMWKLVDDEGDTQVYQLQTDLAQIN